MFVFSFSKKIFKKFYNNFKKFKFIAESLRDQSTSIEKNVYISNDSVVGRHCYINEYTRVTKATIGNFVSIGNNVAIGQGEHPISKLSTSTYFIKNPYDILTQNVCKVGNDVWLGSYSFIKRGVTIGDGAVIGTHAVVLKDVPDYAIAVGVPAKVIGYRFPKPVISELKKIKWWYWSDQKIKKNMNLFQDDLTMDMFDKIKKFYDD